MLKQVLQIGVYMQPLIMTFITQINAHRQTHGMHLRHLAEYYFTYNAATKRLKYFLGDPAAGTYAQRANLAIPQTMVDGQNITGELSIGKAWTGVGGSGFSGFNWDGGVNNMIASNMEFTGPQLTEYFQDQSGDPDNPSDSFSNAEFYPDLVAYAKLGEDTYPAVTDTLGNLLNGELMDGAADDFKDMPTA